MIGIKGGSRPVALLPAQAVKGLDFGFAMGAVHPFVAGAPFELGPVRGTR